MRRLLAAVGAASMLVLATGGPAAAAPPSITIASPDCPLTAPCGSLVALDVTVRMDGGTLRDDIVVEWSGGPAGAQRPEETRHATGNAPNKRVELLDQPFPWNGTYSVTVRATGRRDHILAQPDEHGTGTRDFVVDAPPAAPTGVTTSVGGDRSVTIRWTANTEQQLFGYEVQRQLGSDPWKRVTVTDATTTTVVDQATTSRGGTYRHRVVAFRHSAEAGKLLPSLPSGPSTTKVPAPPATTTTTTTTAGTMESGSEAGRAGSARSTNPATGSRTSTRGAGPTTGGPRGGGASSPTFSAGGKVDLSGFSSLLEQARLAGKVPPPDAVEEPDSGFDERLPFAGRPGPGDDDPEEAGGDVVIGESPVPDDGHGRATSLAFLAGGLLATVLVMHLLWVRGEVHRADMLEAITPGGDVGDAAYLEAVPRRRRRAVRDDDREPVAVG